MGKATNTHQGASSRRTQGVSNSKLPLLSLTSQNHDEMLEEINKGLNSVMLSSDQKFLHAKSRITGQHISVNLIDQFNKQKQ